MNLQRAMPLLALAFLSPLASATTVSVGSGAGCTYATLQAAFDALDNEPGSHAIHLRRETIAIADGVTYQPTVAQTSLFIEGGYAECADGAPSGLPIDGSVLEASGGLQRPAVRLRIEGRVGSLQIRRVAIQGGDADDSGNAYNGAGGGLAVIGPASVLLGAGASVRNNHALKGGGVALIGGLLSSTTPARVDFYLTEGASISNNAAVGEGGGVYCGGTSVPGSPTSAPRHASLVVVDGTIGFNTAGGLGGAFFCHGSVEGGGGFQPRPASGAVALIIGNQTTAGGGCAAGSGTLDTTIAMDGDGFRPLGAADGSTGLVAVANNEGTRPALCLAASRTIGTDNYPEGPSTFRLQNLIVTGQHGTGDLGLVLGSPELRVRVQPSGKRVACEFFTPTPCVSFADNAADGAAGTGSTSSVVSALGRLELVRASVRDNTVRNALMRNYQRTLRVESSVIAGNTVQASAASPTRSAFAAGFNALYPGEVSVVHSTVVFDSPLDRFFDLQHADSHATARAGIFASSVVPAPANVGGIGAPSHLQREWCGFFQDTGDFASHTVVPDPTTGTFMAPGPGDFGLDPVTFVPGAGLVDWCTRSVAHDFHGRPFGSVVRYPDAGPADIGAVENRDDVIFAYEFEA